jgi:hypothetical protein
MWSRLQDGLSASPGVVDKIDLFHAHHSALINMLGGKASMVVSHLDR